MPPGNAITGGAICDLWIITDDTVPEVTLQPVKQTPWVVETCTDCDKIYNSTCIMTGKTAIKRCKDYVRNGLGSYKENTGHIIDSGHNKSMLDNCNNSGAASTIDEPVISLDADFTEDKEECALCIEAYYNNNIPWCRFKNEAVKPNEWCSRFVRES